MFSQNERSERPPGVIRCGPCRAGRNMNEKTEGLTVWRNLGI